MPTTSGSGDAVADDESPANESDTRAYLLERSKRGFAPIANAFVQVPQSKAFADGTKDRSGPLATFVRNGDLRGLRALLFLHAIISNGAGDNGWSTTLPLSVWSRVFDTTVTADSRSAASAATRILTRLEQRAMIRRARKGRAREVTVTLLRPDGSGLEYSRPDGKSDRFIKLRNEFWSEGWYAKLDLPATAMLLVCLHEKPEFSLPTERMQEWYGFSPDTAERGLRTLCELGLLTVSSRLKKSPLSPSGVTRVNFYELTAVLAPPTRLKATGRRARARKKGSR
ncbi:hypothetical protein GCM10027067_33910 [Pseudactinotalea suaedae]